LLKARSRRDATAIQEFVYGTKYENNDEDADTTVLRPHSTVDARVPNMGRRTTGPLKLVESSCFQALVGALLVGNMAALIKDATNGPLQAVGRRGSDAPFYEGRRLGGLCFLSIYVFEVALRLVHFGSGFFFAECADETWLNWLDIFAISLGVLDQWIFAIHNEISPFLAFRCVRALKAFWRSCGRFHEDFCGDFRWVDCGWWQWLVASVIAFNALVMGLETEIESLWWDWIEQALLIFFTIEIALRLRRSGVAGFFASSDDQFWNYFDLGIVVTGIAEQWLDPIFAMLLPLITQDEGSGGATANFRADLVWAVKFSRLLRILRLLRLVKTVRPLYHLATGFMYAMQSMFWVLILTLVVLYGFALVATSFLGRHSKIDNIEDILPEQRRLFRNVLDSTFTLFGLMNGQYWQDVVPIFEAWPWVKPVYVAFIIVSSWALLSVMTGVVSDNMLKVRQLEELKETISEEEFRDQLDHTIKEIFLSADLDGDGRLDKCEYEALLSSKYHADTLLRYSNVYRRDLVNMFDWIDVNTDEKLEVSELLQGLCWLNDPVTGKSLMKLESSIKRRFVLLEKSIINLRWEMEQIQATRQLESHKLLEVLRKLKERCEEDAALKFEEAEALREKIARFDESDRRHADWEWNGVVVNPGAGGTDLLA